MQKSFDSLVDDIDKDIICLSSPGKSEKVQPGSSGIMNKGSDDGTPDLLSDLHCDSDRMEHHVDEERLLLQKNLGNLSSTIKISKDLRIKEVNSSQKPTPRQVQQQQFAMQNRPAASLGRGRRMIARENVSTEHGRSADYRSSYSASHSQSPGVDHKGQDRFREFKRSQQSDRNGSPFKHSSRSKFTSVNRVSPFPSSSRKWESFNRRQHIMDGRLKNAHERSLNSPAQQHFTNRPHNLTNDGESNQKFVRKPLAMHQSRHRLPNPNLQDPRHNNRRSSASPATIRNPGRGHGFVNSSSVTLTRPTNKVTPHPIARTSAKSPIFDRKSLELPEHFCKSVTVRRSINSVRRSSTPEPMDNSRAESYPHKHQPRGRDLAESPFVQRRIDDNYQQARQGAVYHNEHSSASAAARYDDEDMMNAEDYDDNDSEHTVIYDKFSPDSDEDEIDSDMSDEDLLMSEMESQAMHKSNFRNKYHYDEDLDEEVDEAFHRSPAPEETSNNEDVLPEPSFQQKTNLSMCKHCSKLSDDPNVPCCDENARSKNKWVFGNSISIRQAAPPSVEEPKAGPSRQLNVKNRDNVNNKRTSIVKPYLSEDYDHEDDSYIEPNIDNSQLYDEYDNDSYNDKPYREEGPYKNEFSDYPVNRYDSDGTHETQTLSAYFICVGSHKTRNASNVIFSVADIRLIVPAVDDSSLTMIELPVGRAKQILFNYDDGNLIVYLEFDEAFCEVVRKRLGMTCPTPYFSNRSTDPLERRIAIFLLSVAPSHIECLQQFYPKLMRPTKDQGFDYLNIQHPQEGNAEMHRSEASRLLTYPFKANRATKGAITITSDDYLCLEEEQFLNDIIIDFYLALLSHTKLSMSEKRHTHFFSTFFYKRLTAWSSPFATNGDNPQLAPLERRHARVKTWTKDVDIFSKDFIVIPINEKSHWFLAIICFAGLDGPIGTDDGASVKVQSVHETRRTKEEDLDDDMSDRDEASSDDEFAEDISPEAISQPCILIFDSLAGPSRRRIFATLRDYLTVEYRLRRGVDKVFTPSNCKGHCPVVPQQNNFTDCGIFTLQYAENFFAEPIRDFSLPITSLVNWFPQDVINEKRQSIANIIRQLVIKHYPKREQLIPNLLTQQAPETHPRNVAPNPMPPRNLNATPKPAVTAPRDRSVMPNPKSDCDVVIVDSPQKSQNLPQHSNQSSDRFVSVPPKIKLNARPALNMGNRRSISTPTEPPIKKVKRSSLPLDHVERPVDR